MIRDELSADQLDQLADRGFVTEEQIQALSKLLGTHQKISVTNNSFESLADEGFEVPDSTNVEKEFYAKLVKKGLFQYLTDKQQRILICLSKGMTREQTSSHLVCSRQSVNQIIPRIRKRLKAIGISYEKITKGGSKPHMALFSLAS